MAGRHFAHLRPTAPPPSGHLRQSHHPLASSLRWMDFTKCRRRNRIPPQYPCSWRKKKCHHFLNSLTALSPTKRIFVKKHHLKDLFTLNMFRDFFFQFAVLFQCFCSGCIVNNSSWMDRQVFLFTSPSQDPSQSQSHGTQTPRPMNLCKVELDSRTVVPFLWFHFSVISIAGGQLWTEDIKWKIPEIKLHECPVIFTYNINVLLYQLAFSRVTELTDSLYIVGNLL